MPRPTKNLLGYTSGRLTVVASAPMNISIRKSSGRLRRNTAWLCRCLCGRETVVKGYNLIGGSSTSCGICWRQKSGAAFRQMLRCYKTGASERGYEFSLTDSEVSALIKEPCF